MSIKVSTKNSKKQETANRKIDVRSIFGNIAVKDGIVITDSGYTAFLEVMPVNFALKSKAEQEYIIDRYEEAKKAVKIPLYYFTLSRRGDSRAHIDSLRKMQSIEENESVKEMDDEYIDYVQQVSYTGSVKERWIIGIPYTGQKNDRFQTVSAFFAQKKSALRTALRQCGNDIVSPQDEDQFAIEILFELLNVKLSESERVII